MNQQETDGGKQEQELEETKDEMATRKYTKLG